MKNGSGGENERRSGMWPPVYGDPGDEKDKVQRKHAGL